jgi:hypothetical protein
MELGAIELNSLHQLLTTHFIRYPHLQITDLYKLLHQAALGSEHAVHDQQAARDWLEREMDGMGTGPGDPLFDPLSPDGQILRVHLRPYLKTGQDPLKLLQAFLQTANGWRGSFETLKSYGAAAVQLAQARKGPFRPETVMTYFSQMEKMEFPAAHHSKKYTRHYHPAYRVVARQFLEVE